MELKELKIEKVVPNPSQPRETFDKEKIKELADSIEAQGLLQPIVVRKYGDVFQIIAGERRWRAYNRLKKTEIPAIVWDIESDVEAAEKSLVENWAREDLSSQERENMIYQIKEMGGYTNVELGEKLGLSAKRVGTYVCAKEDRLKLKAPSVSTDDINTTRGLDDKTRKWVLDKMDKGEMPKGSSSRKTIQVLKRTPEKMRKAIVEDKVDVKDVAHVVDIGVPEDKEEEMIERLTERKKDRVKVEKRVIKVDKAEQETDKLLLKGDLKATGIKVDLGPDQKRLRKYNDMWEDVRWWSLSTLGMIKNKPLRDKAVEYIESIGKHCTDLAAQYQGKVNIEGAIDVEEA
jgi:ParB family chromosome partitioning protein|tara:strand:- start:1517 stop:2554 length:1038 start_codon:yes stop_codon:yes gene_type:complete